MPFALTTIGLLLVIVGFQNTYKQFGTQVISDFTGQGNFIYWIIAIGVVGSLGYNKTLEPFSRALLALIVVVIFLGGKGNFFSQFNSAISTGSSESVLPVGGIPQPSASSGGDSSGLFSAGNLDTAASVASAFF